MSGRILLLGIFLVAILVVGGCVSQPAGNQTTPQPSVTKTANVTTGPTIKQPTPVVIPATGIFVKVSYLGGFNGTYGINGTVTKVTSSGDRLYAIDGSAGNVTATFFKQDKSTHALTVEIWKDSKLLTSAANSSAFGRVSVTGKV